MGYQLGLDTGGTYTDAVLVDDDKRVLSSAKALTTHADLIGGLRKAVNEVLSESAAGQVELVSLSTTLATNALVEGRGRAVALVLIGFTPAQMQRANLSEALGGDPHLFLAGGHQASGQAVCPLDTVALRAFVEKIDARVEAYAVSGIFAVRNPAHENAAQSLISEITGKPVTCGHHLSSGLDAPRRALTALLNARLIPLISALLSAARTLLDEHQIRAPLMVVKGDGSLISDAMAMGYPVETILSGPAASVVGAQFLCSEQNLVVSDMGGTTTDIALIRGGQPYLCPDGATVGGWRTMVQAVDVRTYGLGGDSAIVFDRNSRRFSLARQRVMPLSLLMQQHPELLADLEAQLELPWSTTHSAQFVMAHGTLATSAELSYQQRELYDRICEKPIAIQTLFSDQTLERALGRLEQRALVLRSGFTPSDASHILGLQNDWQAQGASLGARLLLRYSKDNLGTVFADEQAFAEAMSRLVHEETAMVLMDTVVASEARSEVLSDSQKKLLRASLNKTQNEQLLTVQPRMHIPVMALGAPARSYYPAASELLSTRLISTEFAHVANALGAVVGTVRQQQVIVITPAGGKHVSVMFPEGPRQFDSLEEGAVAASAMGERLARRKSMEAGAASPTVTLERDDIIVNKDNQSIFIESRITATAVGRPSKIT